MTNADGPKDPGRRTLLTGLAAGGVAGGIAGAAAATAIGSSGGLRRQQLSVDVACLGHTWRDVVPRTPANDADFRAPFAVEGWIYPAGTIPTDGFVPTENGSIGHWFCRGWLVLDGDRPEPHASTIQEYVFGSISETRLFPPDAMTSSGLEGTFTDQSGTRPIIGGTGEYMGAIGQVIQTNNGTNTTVLDDGSGDPAPNFIFNFDYWVPVG